MTSIGSSCSAVSVPMMDALHVRQGLKVLAIMKAVHKLAKNLAAGETRPSLAKQAIATAEGCPQLAPPGPLMLLLQQAAQGTGQYAPDKPASEPATEKAADHEALASAVQSEAAPVIQAATEAAEARPQAEGQTLSAAAPVAQVAAAADNAASLPEPAGQPTPGVPPVPPAPPAPHAFSMEDVVLEPPAQLAQKNSEA